MRIASPIQTLGGLLVDGESAGLGYQGHRDFRSLCPPRDEVCNMCSVDAVDEAAAMARK